jgi:hypothetical protein
MLWCAVPAAVLLPPATLRSDRLFTCVCTCGGGHDGERGWLERRVFVGVAVLGIINTRKASLKPSAAKARRGCLHAFYTVARFFLFYEVGGWGG